jgi:hypothetical protein
MKKLLMLAVASLGSSMMSAQVGIGTLTPNAKSVLELNSSSKGLLLPRMTSTDRTGMSLTSSDAGMMVYQTTSPKGPYTWDGTSWIYYAPTDAGVTTGSTLRWDATASKWAPVTNLFNQGTSIGIGTQNPNNQLQINSGTGPNFTRIQITNSATQGNPGTGSLSSDGLLLGVGASQNTGVAHLLQQENKALWFGTNGIERVRIDSSGKVGVGTANPSATFDVNGTVKVGANGTVIESIMRANIEIDPPSLAFMGEWTATVPCPNTIENSVVYVSPGSNMDHFMIGYARVSSPGFIDIKLMNLGPNLDLGPIMLHIAVIQ